MPKVAKEIFEESFVPLKVWHSMSSTEAGVKHYTMAVALNETDADKELLELYSDNEISMSTLNISFVCTCKGSQYQGNCWHLDMAKEKFEEYIK